MDNKTALNSALDFLKNNLNCFTYKESSENTNSTTTFSYQTESGALRNGRIQVGLASFTAKTRSLDITFYVGNSFAENSKDNRIRKLIPKSGEIKFDKQTKNRLNDILKFVEKTYSWQEETINFKKDMKSALSDMGIDVSFDIAFESFNGSSLEIEIKERVANFSVFTDDPELLRKLHEVCKNHNNDHNK